MKKKTILNICMVLTIILMAVCGIMAVGSVKGWFGSTGENVVQSDGNVVSASHTLKVQNKSGIVMVERKGIAYEIENGDSVRDGDILYTRISSEVTLSDEEGSTVTLGENSELSVNNIEEMSFSLAEGESFVSMNGRETDTMLFVDKAELVIRDTVCTVTAYAASSSVYVYSGNVTVQGEALEPMIVKEKEAASILTDESGNVSAEMNVLAAETLSDDQIQLLQAYGSDLDICFTDDELQKVVTAREEEKLAAQQAQLLLAEQAKEDLKQEKKEYEKGYADYQASLKTGQTASASTSDSGSTEAASSGSSSSAAEEDEYQYCTIEIRCDTILNNLENLESGKERYVPSNGVILSRSKLEFSEGETVFDVLKRACSRADIQLEYSWTPLYNSYYIEGINHLYEFDCGDESGWMYKVNGWFPNYGCSSYDLEDGDVIVWCYTCNGLGADVGGSTH